MTHPDSDELGQLVDDELDEPRKTEVIAHVRECDACGETVRSYLELDAVLRRAHETAVN